MHLRLLLANAWRVVVVRAGWGATLVAEVLSVIDPLLSLPTLSLELALCGGVARLFRCLLLNINNFCIFMSGRLLIGLFPQVFEVKLLNVFEFSLLLRAPCDLLRLGSPSRLPNRIKQLAEVKVLQNLAGFLFVARLLCLLDCAVPAPFLFGWTDAFTDLLIRLAHQATQSLFLVHSKLLKRLWLEQLLFE